MSINFLYGTFVLILYCTPICLVESSCLTKSPYSSSDLRTLSISLFSFCLAFPSTSIILVRGPLVYPSISGNIRQPKMEPSLRQNTQNRVCYVVYRLIRSSRNMHYCYLKNNNLSLVCQGLLALDSFFFKFLSKFNQNLKVLVWQGLAVPA